MKKIILTTLAMSALMSAPASADPAAMFNWTGFYAGGNGGYGWTDKLLLGDTDSIPPGTKIKGGFGGAQLGYNWQSGNFVFGFETDFEGSGVKGSVDEFNTGVNWFGTVRGRAGLAFDRLLVYATGGFAYGRVVTNVTDSPLSVRGSPYHLDRTATGYVAGGGFEYAFASNWSAKIEYQYINLGKNNPTGPLGSFTSVLGGDILKDTAFNTVRAGINYRF